MTDIQTMTDLEIVLFAYLGGIAINVVRLGELANIPKDQRPPTFRDPFYLIQFFIVPALGIAFAFAYQLSGHNLTAWLTMHIGASAPLIAKNLAAAVPPIGQRRID